MAGNRSTLINYLEQTDIQEGGQEVVLLFPSSSYAITWPALHLLSTLGTGAPAALLSVSLILPVRTGNSVTSALHPAVAPGAPLPSWRPETTFQESHESQQPHVISTH